jgi:drug/metabolite transporter (DMT)-like permease
MFIGFVFSAFLFSAMSSIAFGCPIPVTVALIYTQPFFTAIIAFISKREKITLEKLVIVVGGVIGAFLVSGMTPQQILNLNINLGVLLAYLGGLLYAVYLFLKRTQKKSYSPLQALFNTFLFAVPCTLILGVILRLLINTPILVSFSVPNPYQLSLLILFAVFSTVLPYGTLNYVKTNEVSPTTEGTILLLDPALHVIWATMFFKQYVMPLQYVGIALILISASTMLKT